MHFLENLFTQGFTFYAGLPCGGGVLGPDGHVPIMLSPLIRHCPPKFLKFGHN